MSKTSTALLYVLLATVFIPVFAEANSGDFTSGVAIGTSYAGVDTAPTNGLLVQGSVGIGTTSPITQLEVTTSTNGVVAPFLVQNTSTGSSAAAAINIGNNTSSYAGILQVNGGNAPGGCGANCFGINAPYGPLALYAGSGAEVQIPANNAYFGEDVGIGTTSPSYTLQVNGSVAGTSAYVNTSDIRYKKNIRPLVAGLKEVTQLKPVTFEWKKPKDDGMRGQQIGFVAQDVEKLLPSIVLTENNTEKTKGMKYTEIIPVLVKAIQEQQTQIDELRQAVAHLKRQGKPTQDDEDDKTALPPRSPQ